MKNRFVSMPAVGALLFAAGCGGDEVTGTGTDTRVSVRFVNMTTGLSGSGGFTAKGQFIAGSALASGQVAQTCTKLDAGQTSLGFGVANSAGTGLSGNELATLLNETISAKGDYTLVAAGLATSPTLHLFSNGFSGSLSSSQAAVRFVSFVPPTGTTVYNYVFYSGPIAGNSPLVTNLPFGVPSGYSVLTVGANSFSALQTPGATILLDGSPVTLQASSANTIAVVRDGSGAYKALNLPKCS